jgi:hypothetical protein
MRKSSGNVICVPLAVKTSFPSVLCCVCGKLLVFQGLCSVYDMTVNGKHPVRIVSLLWKSFIVQNKNGSLGHCEQCLVVTPSNCDTPAIHNNSCKECSKHKHDCKYLELAFTEFNVRVKTRLRWSTTPKYWKLCNKLKMCLPINEWLCLIIMQTH